jgi:hypothetical protein
VFRHQCASPRPLPSVLGVNGLTRHPEGVADLLPGPSAFAGQSHVPLLDLLGQPVKGTNCSQADRRVVRLDSGGELARGHAVSLN